jgi:hypothetical protein
MILIELTMYGTVLMVHRKAQSYLAWLTRLNEKAELTTM